MHSNFVMMSAHCIFFSSLSTQEHYMSAKEIRKLLCEFINSILTDLDAGREAIQSVKFSLMLGFVNVLVLLFIWQKNIEHSFQQYY